MAICHPKVSSIERFHCLWQWTKPFLLWGEKERKGGGREEEGKEREGEIEETFPLYEALGTKPLTIFKAIQVSSAIECNYRHNVFVHFSDQNL